MGLAAQRRGTIAAGISSALTLSQEVLADSPAGYWKFNEGSGTSITDYSGNGNTLTAHATPTMSNSGPLTGETCATLVSASSQYFDHADANVFDLADIFTLELWYKRSSVLNTFQYMISKGANAYALLINNSNILNSQRQAQADLTFSTGSVGNDSTWHHVVFTKTGATKAMYLDGADVSNQIGNQTCTDTTTGLFIGVRSDLSNFLDGSIGHVAVYPTALSSTRVAAHFAARV